MSTPIETTAVLDLTPGDLDDLVEELRTYHGIYSPLFQRREQREWAAQYLHGLLLDLPRKSIEPLALAVEGVQLQAVRAMQQFISEGSWDDTALLHRH
jgi:SRSO17 transposase